MKRTLMTALVLTPLLVCSGCLVAAAAGVVGGAWYLASDSTATMLVPRNFDTTWFAAMKIVSYRQPKRISELRADRRIEVEDAIDLVIEVEPLDASQTRIRVSARDHGGLTPDADTAQWVAERIVQEAIR